MTLYVVHSGGKVASTSIANALKTVGLNKRGSRVFKTHALNQATIATITQNNPAVEPGHVIQSKDFLKLFQGTDIDHCYVIIGQREPVSKALSKYFQNINKYLKKTEVTASDFDALLESLDDWAAKIMRGNFTWWKREVEEVFDVDLFAYDFNKRLGVTVIEPTERLTFVLYTLEHGMQRLPHVLEEITGREPIQIGVANTVADKKFFKPYQNHSVIDHLYKEVVGSFKLPLPVLEEVYHHPISQFFYDGEQIAGFIERWREPAP